jgi:hypothetical protein
MSEYLFVKPGMATGGATFADILTAEALRNTVGEDVRFLTGCTSLLAADFLVRHGLDVEVEPMLDRKNHAHPYKVAQAILDHTTEDTRVIASQFFANQEAAMSEALRIVAKETPLAVRMHNAFAATALTHYAELPPTTIGLPIHGFMEERMRRTAPQCETITIPPIFDTNRFTADLEIKEKKAAIVKQAYGIGPEEIVLVQPTNICSRKAPSTSVYLAAAIKEKTAKEVSLIIGGNPISYPQETEKLVRLSTELDVICHMGGRCDSQRIGNLLCAAAFATMPSYVDDVMLSVAEAAYCRIPIFTRAYVDQEGEPVFDSVYGDLDCIVQRDGDEMPNEGVVQGVCEVLEGERMLDLEGNATFVKSTFTARGIARKLEVLHRTFDALA